MADDLTPIPPPVPEDEHAEHEFETLESSGAVDARDTPISEAPPAKAPAPKPEFGELPEWAKGGKAPPAPAKPGEPAPTAAVSQAARTLAGRKQSIQAEIDALTTAKYTTKREVEAARAEVEQLRAEAAALRAPAARHQPAAPEPAAPAGETPEPQLEQFESYEQYSVALAKWARAEAVRETREFHAQERAAQEEQWRASQQQQEQQQIEAAHYARIDKFRAEHPDYDTLLAANAHLPTNPMMDQHFLRADTGPSLMHYLASHPDECTRIASLPPGPTLVALGRIEARLEAATAGPTPRPIARTHARPPIKPVGSSPIGADGGPPDESASLDEHAEYYDRLEQARRAR